MNKKNQPNKAGKGPGFGDALLNMKNMQLDYENVDEAPIVTPPDKVPEVKRNPIASQGLKKPVPGVKPPIATKPSTLQQKQEMSLSKQEFKIAPGRQFQNLVHFLPLLPVPYTNGVFELATTKKRSEWEYNVFCDGVPADQIVPQPQVSFNFNAEEVKQGSLGNCYFISALAGIAHHPETLRARIPNFKEYSGQTKSFRVNLFQSGKCIEMLVDNLFPKLYCKPVMNDISPMVLEKAYAQSYGNFEVINIGHSSDALRDLSGAPTVYLDFKNKEELRVKIQSAFANKYGVVIASKAANVHPSLSSKHSYNVLSCEQIKGQIFLMLRDPRGWTKASFDVPHPLENMPEKGMFWASQKVLEQNFEVLTICKIMKNYQYFYKAFGQKEVTNNRSGLLMTIRKPMKVFVTIHQKHKKFYDQKFSYEVIRLLISEVSTTKNSFEVVRTLKSDFNAQQVCCLEVQLQPSSYLILAEISKKKGKQLFPQQIFTVSVYSESDQLEFQLMSGNIDPKPLLIDYIRNNKEQFGQSSTQQGLHRCQGPLFGYICMYYENRGKKKVLQEVEYTVKNIEISEKKVQMGPNTSTLIIHAIGKDNNCSHQCSMKSKTFYS